MHEISLVQGLFEQLYSLAAEHGKHKVVQVYMEIGPFSGVVIDSFQFGFDALAKEDSLLENAILTIESPKAQYRCCGCGKTIEEEQRPKSCPSCSEIFFSAAGSEDIVLLRVEME